MKYIVKCFHCEKNFEVKREENGADFICPDCGKVNNIRDVIERIEEEKPIDPDLQAIKDFDISEHPLLNELNEEEYMKFALENKAVRIVLGIILFIIIVVIVFFLYIIYKVGRL